MKFVKLIDHERDAMFVDPDYVSALYKPSKDSAEAKRGIKSFVVISGTAYALSEDVRTVAERFENAEKGYGDV